MSEYQYYEFRAIDRMLTAKEMQELRAISTRAEITKTSFTNEYNFGSLKGNPILHLEKYFDVFYYASNLGSSRLAFRFPKKLLELKEIKQYFIGSPYMALKESKDYIIIDFTIEDEEYADRGYDPDYPKLDSIISLRADILNGDYRSLYLGYLLCKKMDEKKARGKEPEIPSNLGSLTPTLKSFIEFIYLEPDIVKEATNKSKSDKSVLDNDKLLKDWIHQLEDKTKNDILYSFLKDTNPTLRMEILKKFRLSTKTQTTDLPKSKKKKKA
jgi:hypothetical protein